MGQLSPRKGPPRMQSLLSRGTASALCPCFANSTVKKAVSCYKADQLVTSLLQRSIVACSSRILCCRGRTLRTRPRTDVCEPLMPEAHPNNRSYVSSADLPSGSLRKNIAWWAVTRRTSKSHKLLKLVGGRLPRTIRY